MKQSDDLNAAARAERLAAALRENLKRRKTQAKGRVAPPSDVQARNEEVPSKNTEN